MGPTAKIIQIVPCTVPIWAEYESKPNPNFTNAILCLALVEEKGSFDEEPYRYIVGCDATSDEICVVTGNGNFVGYRSEPIPEKEDLTAPDPRE